MIPGFQQETVLVRTSDGLNDELVESLVYRNTFGDLLRAPIGCRINGLSVPRAAQSIVPASGMDSWRGGVMHDAGYAGALEIWSDEKQNWIPANYTRKQCDDLLLEILEVMDVPWLKRKTIYSVVRLFGGQFYKPGHA